MRRLMLLRHGKSDRPPGVPDEDRPLTERGRRASELVGQYAKAAHLLPATALVSTSRRTRETFEFFRRGLGRDVPAREDHRLYTASPRRILEVIREAEGACLLVVGHNPGLHELALALVGNSGGKAGEQLRQGFPTAAIAVIDFSAEEWRSIGVGQGRLERFEKPGRE